MTFAIVKVLPDPVTQERLKGQPILNPLNQGINSLGLVPSGWKWLIELIRGVWEAYKLSRIEVMANLTQGICHRGFLDFFYFGF
jgi:hypothetical protein